MKEKFSREAWAVIGLIILMNLVSIVSSGFLSHAIPLWIHVFEFCILLVAAIFIVLEVRRQICGKQVLRRTKNNGTV